MFEYKNARNATKSTPARTDHDYTKASRKPYLHGGRADLKTVATRPKIKLAGGAQQITKGWISGRGVPKHPSYEFNEGHGENPTYQKGKKRGCLKRSRVQPRTDYD